MMPQQDREDSRIQCLECGKWFRALPHHIIRTHKISVEHYRTLHAIPIGFPLVCKEWSEKKTESNIRLDLKRTLEGKGPKPGFKQSESTKKLRADHYARLADAGKVAREDIDKTEDRREQLKPYPVTVDEAMKRLGCTRKAAYGFLSYCTLLGRLKRVKRGSYDEVSD